MWLETIATVVTGFIGPTQGEWCYDLCGNLTDDSATGGPLDDLEAETGQKYPDLQAKRQKVVDAWRGWQRAFFKQGPWNNYVAKCEEFASALETATISSSPAGPAAVSLGGFFEEMTGGKLLILVVSIMVVFLLVMALSLKRR